MSSAISFLEEKRKSCLCQSCVRACKTAPGWMTIEEAEGAIEDGQASFLMCDWWEPDSKYNEKVYLLCPASEGCEGKDAPTLDSFSMFFKASKGRCTFLTIDEKCSIHDSGFKPLECRDAVPCNYDRERSRKLRSDVIVAQWNTEKGKELIKRWMELVNTV